MKLISVERYLLIQDIDNNIVDEILLDISLDKLLNIVEPEEDDYLLYNTYPLDEHQLSLLLSFMNKDLNVDFDKNLYFLNCLGNYEW